jgi:hypothetical protein
VRDHIDHRLAFVGGGVHQKTLSIRGGLWEKILVSTTLLRAQRQMADFGAGGQQPIWARNGRELFYLDGNALIAVEIEGDAAALQPRATRRLFTMRRRTEGYRGLWKRRHVRGRPRGKTLSRQSAR